MLFSHSPYPDITKYMNAKPKSGRKWGQNENSEISAKKEQLRRKHRCMVVCVYDRQPSGGWFIYGWESNNKIQNGKTKQFK